MRVWLQKRFGRWWWMMFEDRSCIGPMDYRRVLYGREHGWVYRVEWSREPPCEYWRLD